ncbi:MAG TPA: hypothetical protein VGR92_06050 [Steroidobacteraceae bacterium]|nr:hypothetical protein [Steroidobacteraceae bacterium]
MAVTYVQEPIFNAGSSPWTPTAFTPGAAGNCILAFALDGSGTGITINLTGTGTWSKQTPPGQFNDSAGDTWTVFANTNTTHTSQTVTVSGNSGDGMYVIAPEYSGVGSITGIAPTTRSSPGTGTNAILGAAQTVPTGGVLVALCMDLANSPSGSITTSGTARGGNNLGGTPVCVAEYSGSGGSITPAFTSPDGGSAAFIIVQFVLSPPATAAAFTSNSTQKATSSSTATTAIRPVSSARTVSAARGPLTSGGESLQTWNVGGGDLRREIITGPTVLDSTSGPEPCGTVHDIYPVNPGTSGSLTITDNGVEVFTIAAANITPGVVIPVGETCWHDITISAVPTGGEFGVSWQYHQD